MKRIGCLLLAVCLLLCGCSKQDDAPPPTQQPTEATQPQADTQGEAGPAVGKTPKGQQDNAQSGAWREAYAQAALDSLLDPELKAHSIALFHNNDEPPLLVMTYTYTHDDEGWRRFRRVWKYESPAALVVYEGEDYIEGVRPGTGNPVVFSQRFADNVYTDLYTEHGPEQTTPLLEYTRDNYGQNAVYRSPLNGSSWDESEDPHGERLAALFVQQMEALPLVDKQYPEESAYPDLDPGEKIRDFLRVSGWSADVPADAPAWVGEYIYLLRNHLFFSYYPDRPVNIAQEGLSAGDWEQRWTGVKLLEPPEPGAAPILGGSFVALAEFGDDTKAIPLKNRMLLISDGPDDGYSFCKDTGGRHLVVRWAYTSYLWQVVDEYDLQTLFRSGVSYLREPLVAYLDDESIEFEEYEPAMEWMEEQVGDRLTALGYGDLVDWPQTEIHLPEVATWNEVESILAEAFCNYARQLGQMK